MAPIQTPTRIPTTVNDYTILPLQIPSTTAAFPSQTTHYLYIRAHNPKIPTADTAREVFVVNLPVDATEAHLRALFASQSLGGSRVEGVEFEGARRKGGKVTVGVMGGGGRKRKRGVDGGEDGAELPGLWDRGVLRGGGTAVVRFVDGDSAFVALREVRKVAKLRGEEEEVVWGEGLAGGKVSELGLSRYLTHQTLRFPSAPHLQSSIDAYMLSFSTAEQERAKLLSRQRAVPDEDGFVTVTKGGRAGPARQEEAIEKSEKQKEKRKGKEDFYRFQMREKRKEQAGELMRGFQEDRKRVEEMKGRRNRFRPN